MLNALSTAMFALTLRVGSESDEAPPGLLALAGHPRLAPALAAMFGSRPARGHCLSWHVFAICRGRLWHAISRSDWGVRPATC